MNARPELGFTSPVNILKVVVFPAPFIPSSPNTSPYLIPNEISLTPTYPYIFFSLSIYTE